MSRRTELKYLVDALLFVDMCAVSMVGLLLGFVIPRGPGQGKVFLGLHRHDWADIHLQLSLLLIGLLVVHLVLSWSWITGFSRRHLGPGWKTKLWLLCAAWLPLVALGWLLKRC